MTLHHEAMMAEVEYRREQARRSWPTRSPRTTAAAPERWWQTAAQWARRLTRSGQLDHRAPQPETTPTEPTVRIHITCWTDGSPSARQVGDSVRTAMAQHFRDASSEMQGWSYSAQSGISLATRVSTS